MPEITTNGMAIAPNVIDTIVSLALKDVPGVDSTSVAPTGLKALFSSKATSDRVKVFTEPDGSLAIEVTLRVLDILSKSLPHRCAPQLQTLLFCRLVFLFLVWISVLMASTFKIKVG